MFSIKGFWAKKSKLQRVLLVGFAVVLLAGIGVFVVLPSEPGLVAVIDAPIFNEADRDRIVMRINQEGVEAIVNPAGIIQVEDEATARRIRGILVREGLIPAGMDPWAIFDREHWIITEFERNVNHRRAITQLVTDQIKAQDGVDNAYVTIVMPADDLIASERNPITASVIVSPIPGSDIVQSREKLEGIMTLLQSTIKGLRAENIIICDNTGVVLNDFDSVIPDF